MSLAALVLLATRTEADATTLGPAYSGRERHLEIELPRLEAAIEIDGRLDEPAWARAARLTAFTTYAPVDGGEPEQRTEVRVFYSPTAIYFGVKAEAPVERVRATLAQRDRLDTEDQIRIFLSTFNDARQAQYFAVNPLGVQADGVLVEGTGNRSGGFFSGLSTGREEPDLAPDYVFDSKGQLSEAGYEVEIRIPFKSLRFQAAERQTWRMHVTRQNRSNDSEDSWAPARRAAASFLAQAGSLVGLTGLRRGLVLDLTPEATGSVAGAATGSGGAWRYDADSPQLGGNLRWGVTPDLGVNAALNPDFSQVEADAGQLSFDPRSSVFFPEKRPFFLDGIEQFQTPNRLIYTRRIADPVAALKLTGKLGATGLAALAAVDGESASRNEAHPLFGVLRAQRDVGQRSKVAIVYTHREDGSDRNIVAGADALLGFGQLWSLQLQGAVSHSERAGRTSSGPLWDAILSRNGRRFGLRWQAKGISDEFRTEAGFIERPAIARLNLDQRVTFFGPEGGLVESFSADATLDGVFRYRDLGERGPLERKLHLNNNAVLRGGWRAGVSVLIERFDFDEDLYADYALLDPSGAVRPFVGTPYIRNLDWVLSTQTPRFRGFSANGFWLFGRDENFFEWSPADIQIVDGGLDFRPTERLRLEARYQLQKYDRRSDGTTAGQRSVPRARIDYQVTRALSLRLIGELDLNRRDDLRDDTRTELPILIRNAVTGSYERAARIEAARLRVDALLAWQPSPGTVVFVGYGSQLRDPEALGTRLRRSDDVFFAKLSYLFRL